MKQEKRPVAFVTGSSRGIGAAIALEFARAGYDIAINYCRTEEMAQDIQQQAIKLGAKAITIQGDVSRLDDIERMFDTFLDTYDSLDVMVNNAGITKFAPYLETTSALFEQLINTDLRGSYFCGQRAAKIMVDRAIQGLIINITSNHQKGCWPIASVYASAKAALNKLTENIALELAPYGIRAVSVAPGYTKTRELSKTPPPGVSHEMWTKLLSTPQRLPLQRFCEPSEVGKACVFLAEDGAAYITGTCLYMDGGALLPVVSENIYTGL